MPDPLQLDLQKVLLNVRRASTDDLLNRVTAFREGMEPEAIVLIEQELESRGIGLKEIAAHGDKLRGEVIQLSSGIAARCSFCDAPATDQGWGWHCLWGRLPLFPRYLYCCKEHRSRVV
jgi:hypothetical protein